MDHGEVLSRTKRNPRKSGEDGFVIALGMIVASAFAPAGAAASEIIDRKRETEGSEEGEAVPRRSERLTRRQAEALLRQVLDRENLHR